MKLTEKWVVRLVQDPYGLVRPVWDLHISKHSDKLFNSEQEAKEAILANPDNRFGMAYVITKIYYETPDEVNW